MITKRSMPPEPVQRVMAPLLLLFVGAIVLRPHATAAQPMPPIIPSEIAQHMLAGQLKGCDEKLMDGYEQLLITHRDDIDALTVLLTDITLQRLQFDLILSSVRVVGLSADLIDEGERCLHRLRELEDRIKGRIKALLPPSTEEPEEVRRAHEERRKWHEERQELLDQIEALMEQLLDYGKDK